MCNSVFNGPSDLGEIAKGQEHSHVIFTPGVFSKGEKEPLCCCSECFSSPEKNGFLSALCHQTSANQLNRDCCLLPKLHQIHTMC